ncbi:hypothetical protein ALQ62_00274 [Pseudomonas coronafaciens pv. zizaniae]|uniref:hypothetical protein n=1 Tax=Pseudomonas coronafaciens TaxID=53409 RepID=UPI000F41444D|nr:hypothetical protein [Pseudomonas coronafaciens]RMN26666.1 hypothetical protein ALQ62_00274 [Pseudomonas coronafaciens pv. zizaniae]
MPEQFRTEVKRLLAYLEVSNTVLALIMATQPVKGFLLRLETSGFRQQITEML